MNAAYPEIGKIKKGAPKNQGLKDLDHFRVVFHPEESKAASNFANLYGVDPKWIAVILPIRTQYDPETGTVKNPNWTVWRTASSRTGLVHKCVDGTVEYEYDPITKKHIVLGGEPRKLCPCANDLNNEIPAGYYANNKPYYCKPYGRMGVMIPQLGRYATLTLETKSWYDCNNLTKQLNAVVMTFGDISKIPFILRRRYDEILVNFDGKRDRQERSLISIEIDPRSDWAKDQLKNVHIPEDD